MVSVLTQAEILIAARGMGNVRDPLDTGLAAAVPAGQLSYQRAGDATGRLSASEITARAAATAADRSKAWMVTR